MSVPSKRISRTRTRTRRSHHKLARPQLLTCPKCGDMMQAHRACPHCGTYKGRVVLKTASTAPLKKRNKAKAAAPKAATTKA